MDGSFLEAVTVWISNARQNMFVSDQMTLNRAIFDVNVLKALNLLLSKSTTNQKFYH